MLETLWRPEADLRVEDIHIQVGSFHWPQWVETEVCDDVHQFSLSLTPRPYHSQGCYNADAGHKPYNDVGDLVFYPASVPFYGRSSGGHQRILRCKFGPDRLRQFRGDRHHWGRRELRQALDLRDGRIRSALGRIAQETLNPGLASHAMAESLLNTVLIDLVRTLHGREAQEGFKGGLAGWQMKRLRERVEAVRLPPPTVGELAELCGISARHLMRGFRQVTGNTVHAYIGDVRLDRARSLLLDTNQAIKAIAADLGFSHPSSFSVAFQRAMGMTPSAFRAQNRAY